MWVGLHCTCRSFNTSQISEIVWASERQTTRDRLKNQLLDGGNEEKVISLGLHSKWKQTLTYFNTWKIHSRGITRNCHFGLRERYSTKHWKSYPSIMVLRELKIKSMSIPETCTSAPPSMMRSQDTLQNENHTSSTSDEEILHHFTFHIWSLITTMEIQMTISWTLTILFQKPLQVSHDEYVTMKGAVSPNQADGSGPNSSAEQASSSVPEKNNSNLPAQVQANQFSRHQREQHLTCASARKHFTCTSASPHSNSHGRRCERYRQRRQIDISYTWAHFKHWFLQHQGAKILATHAKI